MLFAPLLLCFYCSHILLPYIIHLSWWLLLYNLIMLLLLFIVVVCSCSYCCTVFLLLLLVVIVPYCSSFIVSLLLSLLLTVYYCLSTYYLPYCPSPTHNTSVIAFKHTIRSTYCLTLSYPTLLQLPPSYDTFSYCYCLTLLPYLIPPPLHVFLPLAFAYTYSPCTLSYIITAFLSHLNIPYTHNNPTPYPTLPKPTYLMNMMPLNTIYTPLPHTPIASTYHLLAHACT